VVGVGLSRKRTRLLNAHAARSREDVIGRRDAIAALADQCLSEYDENGWRGTTWVDPADVAYGPPPPPR
jgi:hypothetical protein